MSIRSAPAAHGCRRVQAGRAPGPRGGCSPRGASCLLGLRNPERRLPLRAAHAARRKRPRSRRCKRLREDPPRGFSRRRGWVPPPGHCSGGTLPGPPHLAKQGEPPPLRSVCRLAPFELDLSTDRNLRPDPMEFSAHSVHGPALPRPRRSPPHGLRTVRREPSPPPSLPGKLPSRALLSGAGTHATADAQRLAIADADLRTRVANAQAL